MKSMTRFRLSTLLTLTLLIGIGLGWYVDHRQQQRDTANAVELVRWEALQPQWHSVWSRGTTWFGNSGGGASSGTIDQRQRPDGYFTGSDTLTASQITNHDQQLARMSLGGGATTMELPLKTSLNRVLEITAKDGIYSLHEPIVIGSAFGADVKLAVGDRAKVDAMSETFTQPSIGIGESNDE